MSELQTELKTEIDNHGEMIDDVVGMEQHAAGIPVEAGDARRADTEDDSEEGDITKYSITEAALDFAQAGDQGMPERMSEDPEEVSRFLREREQRQKVGTETLDALEHLGDGDSPRLATAKVKADHQEAINKGRRDLDEAETMAIL